eukprot:4189172-Lingulodinium_polyedra.AAC.1
MAEHGGHNATEARGVAAREHRLPDDLRSAARGARWRMHETLQMLARHLARAPKPKRFQTWKSPDEP